MNVTRSPAHTSSGVYSKSAIGGSLVGSGLTVSVSPIDSVLLFPHSVVSVPVMSIMYVPGSA